MSYTLVKSVALSKTIGSQWNEVDISLTPLVTVYGHYYKVFLELSHFSLDDNIYVDLDIFKAQYSNYTNTIVDLLVDIGDITLDTVSELPNTSIKYVKYSDAFRAFYKVNLCNIGQSLPDDYPSHLMNDAYLTRPNYDTDLTLLHSHCLITVNGFVHSTDVDSTKTYVYDAAKTLRKARNNGIGIMSFLDISELTKVSIQDAMISSQVDSNSKLYDRAYIDTGVNLEDRAYFLVLGGYLVFPSDNVLWKVNDTTLALGPSMLPFVERLYESDSVLDLSHLDIDRDPDHPEVFNLNHIKSDNFIRSYLTSRNTFVVITDVNHLSYNRIYLRHSNLPGMFTAYQRPIYPLVVNYGRMAEYWVTEEDNQYSVTVYDSFLRNHILDFYTKPKLELINGHLVPMTPNQHSRSFLLEIGGSNV